MKVVMGFTFTIGGFSLTTVIARKKLYYREKRPLEKKDEKKQKEEEHAKISEENKSKTQDEIKSIEEHHKKGEKEKKRNNKKGEEEKKVETAILFFGVVFSAVAAVAITHALDTANDDVGNFMKQTTEQKISYIQNHELRGSLLLIGFFAIAILYYHGGIIFLSSSGAQTLTDGKPGRVFVDFTILFAEIIIVYLLAGKVLDVVTFLELISILMIIDITWVTYFYFTTDDKEIFFNWIHFDLLTLLFMLVLITTDLDRVLPLNKSLPYVLLAIVLSTRTILDYVCHWKFFSHKISS